MIADAVGAATGYLLVIAVCGWAVWSLIGKLRANSASGVAIDSTLSDVDKDDAPGFFWLQFVSVALLTVASLAIGIGASVALFGLLFAET